MADSSAGDAAHASQEPVVLETTPPVGGDNPTDSAPPAAAENQSPANGEPAASPQPSELEPHRNRAQERIAELVAERNFYRDKFVQAATPQTKPAEPAEPQGPPTLAQYEFDTDLWAQAHAKWTDQQIERRAAAIVERKLGESQERRENESLAEGWQRKSAEFRTKQPDFDAVVGNPELPITSTMTDVIARSDVGPALAYHLGKNPTEAARLSRLPPTLQAAALGRLEATLAPSAAKPPGQPGKPITRAPAPPSPISGASPSAKKLEDMPIEEYLANRPWAYRR